MAITGSGILQQNKSATLAHDLALPPPKSAAEEHRRHDRQLAVEFYQAETQPQLVPSDPPLRNDWLLVPIDRTMIKGKHTNPLELAPI